MGIIGKLTSGSGRTDEWSNSETADTNMPNSDLVTDNSLLSTSCEVKTFSSILTADQTKLLNSTNIDNESCYVQPELFESDSEANVRNVQDIVEGELLLERGEPRPDCPAARLPSPQLSTDIPGQAQHSVSSPTRSSQSQIPQNIQQNSENIFEPNSPIEGLQCRHSYVHSTVTLPRDVISQETDNRPADDIMSDYVMSQYGLIHSSEKQNIDNLLCRDSSIPVIAPCGLAATRYVIKRLRAKFKQDHNRTSVNHNHVKNSSPENFFSDNDINFAQPRPNQKTQHSLFPQVNSYFVNCYVPPTHPPTKPTTTQVSVICNLSQADESSLIYNLGRVSCEGKISHNKLFSADSCSTHSLISQKHLIQLGLNLNDVLDTSVNYTLSNSSGKNQQNSILGSCQLTIFLQAENEKFLHEKHNFLVLASDQFDLILLGLDFLKKCDTSMELMQDQNKIKLKLYNERNFRSKVYLRCFSESEIHHDLNPVLTNSSQISLTKNNCVTVNFQTKSLLLPEKFHVHPVKNKLCSIQPQTVQLKTPVSQYSYPVHNPYQYQCKVKIFSHLTTILPSGELSLRTGCPLLRPLPTCHNNISARLTAKCYNMLFNKTYLQPNEDNIPQLTAESVGQFYDQLTLDPDVQQTEVDTRPNFDNCTVAEQGQIQNIYDTYPGVKITNKYDAGLALNEDGIPFEFDLPLDVSGPPVHCKSRFIPDHEAGIVLDVLKKMEAAGLVGSSDFFEENTIWTSPLQLLAKQPTDASQQCIYRDKVSKKEQRKQGVTELDMGSKLNSSFRLILDQRQANLRNTMTDKIQMPTKEQVSNFINKQRFLGRGDIGNAFYSCQLTPQSAAKQSFYTRSSSGAQRWSLLRAAQGGKSSPAIWNKVANVTFSESNLKLYNQQNPKYQVNGKLEDVLLRYADDLLFGSQTRSGLINVFRFLCFCINKHNLRLNPKKVFFFEQCIPFLGINYFPATQSHKIPDKKLCRLLNIPQPQSLLHLSNFLSILQWYSPYLPGYHNLTAVFRDMLKKKIFCWNKGHSRVFRRIKHLLSLHLELYTPGKDDLLLYTSDSSRCSTGYCLFALTKSNQLNLIQCGGALLSPSLRTGSMNELESASILQALEETQAILSRYPENVKVFLSDANTVSYLRRVKSFENHLAFTANKVCSIPNLSLCWCPRGYNFLSDYISKIYHNRVLSNDSELSAAQAQFIPPAPPHNQHYIHLSPDQLRQFLLDKPPAEYLDTSPRGDLRSEPFQSFESGLEAVTGPAPEQTFLNLLSSGWNFFESNKHWTIFKQLHQSGQGMTRSKFNKYMSSIQSGGLDPVLRQWLAELREYEAPPSQTSVSSHPPTAPAVSSDRQGKSHSQTKSSQKVQSNLNLLLPQIKTFVQQMQQCSKHFESSTMLDTLCKTYLKEQSHDAFRKICKFLHFQDNKYSTDQYIESFCLYNLTDPSDLKIVFNPETFKYAVVLNKSIQVLSRDTLKLSFPCSFLSKQINTITFQPKQISQLQFSEVQQCSKTFDAIKFSSLFVFNESGCTQSLDQNTVIGHLCFGLTPDLHSGDHSSADTQTEQPASSEETSFDIDNLSQNDFQQNRIDANIDENIVLLNCETPFYSSDPCQVLVSDLHCLFNFYNRVISPTQEAQHNINPHLEILQQKHIHPHVPSMLHVKPKKRRTYAKQLARLTFLSKLLDSNFVLSSDAFSKIQASDPDLRILINKVKNNETDQFILQDGILCFREYLKELQISTARPALPLYLAENILENCHMGRVHYSLSEMKTIFEQYFYYPHYDPLALSVFSKCATCSVTKPHKNKKYIQNFIPQFSPGESLHIDFYQNLPEIKANNGKLYRNLLVAVDAASGYLRVAPTQGLTSEEMISAVDSVLNNLPLPRCLSSDHAPGFSSDGFQKHLANRGIQHVRSVARRSQYLGLAESCIKSFRYLLQRHIFDKNNFKTFNWLEHLSELVLHYNNQKCSAKFPFSKADIFLGTNFFSNYRNLHDEQLDTKNDLQMKLVEQIYLKRFKESSHKSLPLAQIIHPGSIVRYLNHKAERDTIRKSRDLQPILKNLFFVLLSTRTGVLGKSLLDGSLISSPYNYVEKVTPSEFLLFKPHVDWASLLPGNFKIFNKQLRRQGLTLPHSEYLGFQSEEKENSLQQADNEFSQNISERSPERDIPGPDEGLAAAADWSDYQQSPPPPPAQIRQTPASTPHSASPLPAQDPPNSQPTGQSGQSSMAPVVSTPAAHRSILSSKQSGYNLRSRVGRKLTFKGEENVALFRQNDTVKSLEKGQSQVMRSQQPCVQIEAHHNIFKPKFFDIDFSQKEIFVFYCSNVKNKLNF